MKYQSFRLQIVAGPAASFAVHAWSPRGEGCAPFLPPFLPEEAGALQTVLWRSARSVETVDSGGPARSPATIGERLFTALFPGEILHLYERSLDLLEADPAAGLRLELMLDPRDPSLAALQAFPWELLRQPDHPESPALSRRQSIVRYLAVPRPVYAAPRPSIFRIVAVAANPRGLDSLDLARELRNLQKAVRSTPGLEIVTPRSPTLAALRQTLLAQECHALHFMGHGGAIAGQPERVLYFETEDGNADAVTGTDLLNKLADFPRLRLVVLNACESAAAGFEPFSGVAGSLVLGGLPAVVAMQIPISDQAAIAFSQTFYQRLAAGDPVDAAVTEGRQAMHSADRESFEWATPVLFLRTPNGESPQSPTKRTETAKPLPAAKTALGRLPIPGPLFIGRQTELDSLDRAWEEANTHVLTLVAFGGVGKSALVAHWLDRMAADGWRGAARILDWSFYSQGTVDRVTSAEPFLDYALRFCADPDPQAGSPHDRGVRLAELLRKERTLLILDGVEPLQYPPGPLAGRLKDPGLAALLKNLAADNPGLCLATTRERVADLANFQRTAPQISLERLDPDSAVELLRRLGVDGREKELRVAAEEFGRHALTLTLLGNYLHKAHRRDIRKRYEIDLHRADERQDGHAFRVIAAYARWLGEGPELSILRLLGLFDRPAESEALKALRANPAIPGLTESLVDLSEEDWRFAVSNLRDHNLLSAADPREPETLDAHPLVRAYFAEEIETSHREAWQEGNHRLYEHLRTSAPEFPDTLEAMQPLYAAIVHGCRAGRQQEALSEVFSRRIRRGSEHFAVNKLGGWASDLTGLSGFFDRLWSQPSTRITAVWQAWVLNEAASDLRSLGRLAEAVEPMQAGLERLIAQENWRKAAASASSLSELSLTLGDVPRAVAFGEQSVELADRRVDAFWRIAGRTAWADALHQAGRWEESAAVFREAEAMQAERQPQYPRLYSLGGFRYCDLLLGRGEPEDGAGLDEITRLDGSSGEAERLRQSCREVLERAEQTLKSREGQYSLLSSALDHLSLGRAHLGLALAAGESRPTELTQAAELMDRAVDGLRKAGTEDFIPHGLLARAALRRFRSDFSGAAADLTEALEIAERGSMRLYACDAHLEHARLCRNQGDLDAARRHVARAREIVKETGYGRREREVGWFEKELAPEHGG